jgi:hypothetical protein
VVWEGGGGSEEETAGVDRFLFVSDLPSALAKLSF